MSLLLVCAAMFAFFGGQEIMSESESFLCSLWCSFKRIFQSGLVYIFPTNPVRTVVYSLTKPHPEPGMAHLHLLSPFRPALMTISCFPESDCRHVFNLRVFQSALLRELNCTSPRKGSLRIGATVLCTPSAIIPGGKGVTRQT